MVRNIAVYQSNCYIAKIWNASFCVMLNLNACMRSYALASGGWSPQVCWSPILKSTVYACRFGYYVSSLLSHSTTISTWFLHRMPKVVNLLRVKWIRASWLRYPSDLYFSPPSICSHFNPLLSLSTFFYLHYVLAHAGPVVWNQLPVHTSRLLTVLNHPSNILI